MSLEDGLFGIHGKALALRSQRLSLLASNIANASTPNYKARDIDFDAALKEATAQSDRGPADVGQAVDDAMQRICAGSVSTHALREEGDV